MQKKVLYVEDDPDMVDLVQMVLDDPRMQTYPAFSGEAAINRAREMSPDLILLDLFLPDSSGWDVFRQIRNEDALRNTPVIVVSACHEKIAGALVEDVPDGAVDYICKPFSPAELRTSVERALQLQ